MVSNEELVKHILALVMWAFSTMLCYKIEERIKEETNGLITKIGFGIGALIALAIELLG